MRKQAWQYPFRASTDGGVVRHAESLAAARKTARHMATYLNKPIRVLDQRGMCWSTYHRQQDGSIQELHRNPADGVVPA